MTDYLSVVELLSIHSDQIRRYGGADGVRDIGVLEELVRRPPPGETTDLIEQAAWLWGRLAQHEPFVDANMRTAFAATYTFLEINGGHLTATAEEAYDFIAGLREDGWFRFGDLEPWLRRNVELNGPADDTRESQAARSPEGAGEIIER
ncbi:MAG: type II toxin-antitoxin system death-on-curing family toxin [Bryobacterales bacterium]|nr:type II toxin-antitoxin system death-on-curing family toxin [Bryobacterales bacterium]